MVECHYYLPSGSRRIRLVVILLVPQPRQRLNRRRLVVQLDMCVDTQRQADITMPRQGLGHLRRHAGAFQVRDEEVPEAMEVGVEIVVVAVAEEVGFEAFLQILVGLRLIKPLVAGGHEVALDHLAGSPIDAPGDAVGDWEQNGAGAETLLRFQPGLDPLGNVRMGPHRSGTSCVAMVMHHLGVHMGNELGGYEATGGGEAVGLTKLCEKAMPFPTVDPKIPDKQLTQQLKSWVVARKTEANRDRTVAGGKYPHLCRFAEHLYAGLGKSLRIIAVDRPIEASIRSLQDRSRKHEGQWFSADDAACERLQRSLLEYRERFIDTHPSVPVHRIEFARLTEDPAGTIARLVDFLGIQPTDEEIQSAIAHVNPTLRKFG